MRDFEKRSDNFFRGLILGGLVGAGVFYFLTATEEGKKVKEKIKAQGKDALGNLADIINELEKKGGEFKKRAKELQVELEKRTKEVSGEIAGEVQSRLSQIEELRERGRKAAKFFTRNGKPLN